MTVRTTVSDNPSEVAAGPASSSSGPIATAPIAAGTNALVSAQGKRGRTNAEEPKFVDVAIVIPAYNEAGAVGRSIEEIREVMAQLSYSYEIVIVNDGSVDGTGEEAEATGVRVIHQQNRGYGASLKRGISETRSTYVVITDADGTYPASALPEMLRLAEEADMVVGDRGAAMKGVPLIRRPAKFVLNSLANYLARRKINDLNSGLRVLRREAATPFLPLLPSGFSFTTTITLCMVCTEHPVVYYPIVYGRRIGQSKIKPTDFFAFMLLVVRATMLFNPLRVFFPVGAILMAAGLVKLVYDVTLMNLSESAVLAMLAGLMAWSLGLIADMISRLHLRP